MARVNWNKLLAHPGDRNLTPRDIILAVLLPLLLLAFGYIGYLSWPLRVPACWIAWMAIIAIWNILVLEPKPDIARSTQLASHLKERVVFVLFISILWTIASLVPIFKRILVVINIILLLFIINSYAYFSLRRWI